MSDPDEEPWLRRVPVLVYVGVVLIVVAFVVDDVRALYLGGALLVIGYLQAIRTT